MYLKNGNLVIRSAEVKDAVQLNAWWNDGAVMAYAGFSNGLGEALEDTIAGIKENEEYLDQLGVLQDSVDYEMTREQFEQLNMR